MFEATYLTLWFFTTPICAIIFAIANKLFNKKKLDKGNRVTYSWITLAVCFLVPIPVLGIAAMIAIWAMPAKSAQPQHPNTDPYAGYPGARPQPNWGPEQWAMYYEHQRFLAWQEEQKKQFLASQQAAPAPTAPAATAPVPPVPNEAPKQQTAPKMPKPPQYTPGNPIVEGTVFLSTEPKPKINMNK
jgi:hypothetical protein